MNSKRLLLCALLSFSSLSLASCGNDKPETEESKVTITVVDGTGGGQFNIGEIATIRANEKEGLAFKEWQVDNTFVSNLNPYTFTVTEDATYVANYKNDKVTITVVGGTGSGTYTIGSEATVTATVPDGKEFVNWTVDGKSVSTKATYTFKVEEDITITANIQDATGMGKYTKTVNMSGDEFKILNLTDIQLHDGDNYEVNEHIISQVVERTEPDLITVLGDTLNDDTTYSTREMPKKIVDLIDSFDIPWAPIFGNHDNITYKPEGTQKYGGVEYLETLFADCDNCLYGRGPEEIQGSSNYIVNIVKETTGALVESLIFLDSFHVGLDQTNTDFYVDAVNYVKELNNNVTPRSIVFDHVPIPQYGTLFTEAENEEFHNMSGVPYRDPLAGTDGSLFPKIKELGSTKAVICGHDHEISFVSDYEGVKLAYAMKSSLGDDPDGNSLQHPVGGLLLTIDGENEEQFNYTKVVDLGCEIKSGKDFPYFPEILPYWQYSGAKLEFDIELPATGTAEISILGTNFRVDEAENLQKGSWNRLTDYIKLDAEKKSVNYGSLTLVKDNKYHYELDLAEVTLNLAGSEKAYGDETARLVYFNKLTADFKVYDIRFEKEEVPVTDQIDLADAIIAPIADEDYLKGRVVRPEVSVTLNGNPLKKVDDILVKYSNEREVGTATVEVVPSGKGAARYKGSKTATFNIVGNPWRGDTFEKGFTHSFTNMPIETSTFTFDVHFTSTGLQTMWFMLGDGWDNYFGYYGLSSDGTLVETYDGVTVAPTEDEYFRVTCVLSLMNKQNAGTPNPTEKVNLFYVHNSWGGEPTGYIDFDLGDAPEVVRGEIFTGGSDKTISFDKIELSGTIVVDFKFTSTGNKYVNFMVGNSADGWGYYNGYYKLNSNGTLEENYDGITFTTLDDGYIRLTLVLADLTKLGDKPKPTEELGYNMFYIRGAWTDASGYVDFNPAI